MVDADVKYSELSSNIDAMKSRTDSVSDSERLKNIEHMLGLVYQALVRLTQPEQQQPTDMRSNKEELPHGWTRHYPYGPGAER